MNKLYKENNKADVYILCVDEDIPISISEDNIYPFEIFSFKDLLDEFPEEFTELGELNEELVKTIIDYTAYAYKINNIEARLDALNADQAIIRYNDWYNNGGTLPEGYVTPESKEIDRLEETLSTLYTKYEIITGKAFTKPEDIFEKVSQAAQEMQQSLQEED